MSSHFFRKHSINFVYHESLMMNAIYTFSPTKSELISMKINLSQFDFLLFNLLRCIRYPFILVKVDNWTKLACNHIDNAMRTHIAQAHAQNSTEVNMAQLPGVIFYSIFNTFIFRSVQSELIETNVWNTSDFGEKGFPSEKCPKYAITN